MFANNLKIICESLNFWGYINLDPKQEYFNPQGFAAIDESLFKITGLRINSISLKEITGLGKPLYERPKEISLSNDSDWKTALKIKRNKRLIFFACLDNNFSKKDVDNKLIPFIEKYFQLFYDSFDSYGIEWNTAEPGVDYTFKSLLKHHRNYRSCGNNCLTTEKSNTPIEKIFKDELINRKIEFEEQVVFPVNGKKFTKPDFVIRDCNILIYCDGATYHNNSERIAMDKQQDRWLQIYGYYPFRYTGSEILANIKLCVDQLEALIKRVKKSRK